MIRVVHLTTVHSRKDIRILLKQCASLASKGFDTQLIVADGLGDASVDGVSVHDVGAPRGRFDRIVNAPGRIFKKALAVDAALYHLHDPELIPIGLRLKRHGKRVIIDFHEDVPQQLLSKPYLHPKFSWAVSRAFAVYERYACRQVDGLIAATPHIRDKFLAMGIKTFDINNFPLLGELDAHVPWNAKSTEVCYVGGISRIRGIEDVITAFDHVRSGVRLNLCGRFSDPELERACKALPGWQAVNELGFVDRQVVRKTLGRSVAGLVTFHPLPNHMEAQPNKMFEYMSAGVPVIASNFPLWREIIGSNQCGLCVDPKDPTAIADAIEYLVQHPDAARRMGENGRRAILERYNWSVEEKKLFQVYDEILAV